ncbi:GntR family transcriptional regulator [Paludisphaera soli]|uniref:GntR family transcriptional regulator n=1 Tax=Paludisphaera soli TaxID=2712865 RepID=UPI0013EC8FD1|nr:GntR family transcriptional regulator [Paludisphaera soli]
MFELDSDDPTPLYAQLGRAIRTAVATGRLKAGDRLPTVRQMAVDLRVNANTVARVYAELERSGVLATRRGVGTFVTSSGVGAAGRPGLERRLLALGDRFLAEAQALGFSAREAIAALEARVSSEGGGHADQPDERRP